MPKLQRTTPHYEDAPERSITWSHAIPIHRMHDGNPVLIPKPDSSWESKVVLNPAAVLITDSEELEQLFSVWCLSDHQKKVLNESGGAVAMLYRAQGETDPEKGVAPSSIGLAVFTSDLKLVWRKPTTAIAPVEAFHHLGVEDGRCTKIEDIYYFFYTGYYHDKHENKNKVHICLSTTADFVRWKNHGPVTGNLNQTDNKNAVLIPEKIHGEWVLLHRPMQGAHAKSMHWATSNSLFGPWETRGMFMASYRYKEFIESWIGAAGPPLPLGNNRFLTIYHQGHYDNHKRREYDLAVTTLDFSTPDTCVAETRIEPLMRPTGKEEQHGHAQLGVDNVLFACANYQLCNDLIIPYAGADSRIFGARIPLNALVQALDS
ncbi:MAG: glycosidase [Bacteroidota bacterium]